MQYNTLGLKPGLSNEEFVFFFGNKDLNKVFTDQSPELHKDSRITNILTKAKSTQKRKGSHK